MRLVQGDADSTHSCERGDGNRSDDRLHAHDLAEVDRGNRRGARSRALTTVALLLSDYSSTFMKVLS